MGRNDQIDEPPLEAIRLGALSERVGPAIRLLRNELTVRVTAAQAPFGLRSGSLSAMTLIDENPGCSQADLARELALDKSVMAGIIADLEAKGLATRSRSPSDRRRNHLALTNEGRRTMAAMVDGVAHVERPIRQALSDQEIASMIGLVRRAYAALMAAEPQPPREA